MPDASRVLRLPIALCVATLAPHRRPAAQEGASSSARWAASTSSRTPRQRRHGGVDREIALAHALHAKVVRVEVPWSELEPPARTDHPAALARRSPDERRRSSRHPRDRDRREHALLGLLGAGVAAARLRPGRVGKANAWPPTNPASYARSSPIWPSDMARSWRRSKSGTSPTRATNTISPAPKKPARYAAILRAAYPAIKQANPSVPVLAGSLVG